MNEAMRQNLDEESRKVDDLIGLILDEQQLLVQSRANDLQPLIERKARCIADLAQLSAGRHALLEQAGYPGSEDGMQQWLVQHPHDETARIWSVLLDRVRKARELNRTNGLLIQNHLQRNRSALRILTGSSVLDNLYGPNGQTQQKAPSLGHVIG